MQDYEDRQTVQQWKNTRLKSVIEFVFKFSLTMAQSNFIVQWIIFQLYQGTHFN